MAKTPDLVLVPFLVQSRSRPSRGSIFNYFLSEMVYGYNIGISQSGKNVGVIPGCFSTFFGTRRFFAFSEKLGPKSFNS